MCDINDFAAGFATLLNPSGVVSFEFPHLLNMVQLNQFDTAYHEHFSYLSLHAVQSILHKQGLQIFNVEHYDARRQPACSGRNMLMAAYIR
jgi:predicted TPR repeat methyltransferase